MPTAAAALRRWFTQPPRAHGEIIEDRTVSFLELFYDLVFVVIIAQAAHALAGDVSWAGFRDFAIVFGLIWLAWANGSLYHELHGGEDGRSRSFIFGQMLLLVSLAVYAGHATDTGGRQFAITYTLFMLLVSLQWWGVRRYDSPEFAAVTRRYVLGNLAATTLIAISALIDDPDARLVLWAIMLVATLLGGIAQFALSGEDSEVFRVTESMAERFGLFTIIVLGEVVVGVADGLSESERTATTVAVGLIALCIGFGFWWSYFDLTGRRQPVNRNRNNAAWVYGHLPMALAIAAAGAGMVSLIEHAEDSRTPTSTAWLISGSTALMLVSLVVILSTFDPDTFRAPATVLLSGAGAAVLIGLIRPAPLLLAIALAGVLVATWVAGFASFIRWRQEQPSPATQ